MPQVHLRSDSLTCGAGWQPATDCQSASEPIIFETAAWNFAISSCVPTVTRTLVGQAGQMRPIMTLFSAIALAKSAPGRFTSIMKKLASLGMYLMFFFSRNAKVSSRICFDLRAPLGHQALHLHAGRRRRQPVHRQEARAVGTKLGQQVRPPHREARAESRHAVNLREGPQHDHVLARRHQVARRLGVVRRSGYTPRPPPPPRPSSYCASRYSISLRGVSVPVGLFGLQT